MRMSWMLSRPIVSATRDRQVEPGTPGRRATTAGLLAGLVLSLVLGLSGCSAGGGSDSATRPTTERSGTRPAPSGTEAPSETTTEPTRPPRTSGDTPTSDRTPTSAPTTAVAGTPAAAESQGLGALGWSLLILLVVVLAAGWLLLEVAQEVGLGRPGCCAGAGHPHRHRHPAATRADRRDAGQRALSWPPLRATLVDLMRRWDLLAQRAPDDQRRNRTRQVRNLLQELVAAVDAENQALATGRDWRLLRPRVDQAEQALSAVLAGVPQPESSAGEGLGGQPRRMTTSTR